MARKNNLDNKNGNPAGEGFRFKYVFLIIVTLLLLLSIYSHNAADMAVIEGGVDTALKNWIGPFGANVSRMLFLLFGIAVYPIALVLVVCALRPFLPIPVHRRGYTGALLAVVIGLTILFAMFPEDFSRRTELLGLGHAGCPQLALSGGVVGQQLAAPEFGSMQAGIIRRYIGTVGTLITGLVFLTAGLGFIWMADWNRVLVRIFTGGKGPARKEKAEEEDEDSEEETSDTDIDDEATPEPDDVMKLERKAPEEPPPKKTADPSETRMDELEHEPDYMTLKKRRMALKAQEKEKDKETPAPTAPPSRAENYSSDDTKYTLPPIGLLEKMKENAGGESADLINESKRVLQATLESFNIDGEVTGIVPGPRVTRYEITLAPGVNINKITNIDKNIAMRLQAESIRILAPIPGKDAVGVEVPNTVPSAVYVRNIMESPEWKNCRAEIPVILGRDVAGKPMVMDLAKAPHLLIAGATGSGKSVCMNTLVLSLLYKFPPMDMRFIMVDPKVVEMRVYSTLPHLITPVVNDPKKVPLALRWAVNEMERRYRVLAKAGAKNLAGFNSRPKSPTVLTDDDGKPIPDKLPIIVIIIDELADVMMTEAKGDVETSVARIAQKGRASGIHIVVATQRPSTNIITGVIKANLPTRIAFRVGSNIDSRVILDQPGAEKLLGRGDMLFIPPGSPNLERIQGAMVSDPELQKVVDFVSAQVEQRIDNSVVAEEDGDDEDEVAPSRSDEAPAGFGEDDEEEMDEGAGNINPIVRKYLKPEDGELVRKALEITILDRKVSTSYLQRRLGIGYNRAAEIVDLLEKRGVVSAPLAGGQKREILIFDEIEK